MNQKIVCCIYRDFFQYIFRKKIFISPELKKHIGSECWKLLLKEFVGVFTTHKENGISVYDLYMELQELFPDYFSEATQEISMLNNIIELYFSARKERKEIKCFLQVNR